jgi:hypothetical protein
MPPRVDVDPQRLLAAHQLANEFYRAHVFDDLRALAYLYSRGIIAATAHMTPWTIVGHQYARACPPGAPAETWVQHDPTTGHSAWVLAEGVGDTTADRDAARLAAQVAGRVAVLVGAHKAVEIARTALNAHFAAQDRSIQGDATICVLTSFDGDHPQPDRGRFTVAWTGDTRAYAATGRWFAALTVDHTLR